MPSYCLTSIYECYCFLNASYVVYNYDKARILKLEPHFFLSEDDWSKRQPDGGQLESCVLIDLANVHSTNHWHDVPCVSDNDARQFICMKPSIGVSSIAVKLHVHI